MTIPGEIVQGHSLSIGSLNTHCRALASPKQQPALVNALERVTGKTLPAALAGVLDAVLDQLDGVVRIRELRVDVEYLGEFDEAALSHTLAMHIARALRDALRSAPANTLRHWPTQDAYLAAYIERRMALTLDPTPSWAFDGFSTLDHLPAERAAAEILRRSPQILLCLARNAAADNDPQRFARALDESCARAIIDTLLDSTAPPIPLTTLARVLQQVDKPLRQLAIAEPARAALSLLLVLLIDYDKPDIGQAMTIAALVTALLHLHQCERAPGNRAFPVEITDAVQATAAPGLSRGVMALVRKHCAEPGFLQHVEDIIATELPAAPLAIEADNNIARARPDQLHSPVAGIGLLLPVLADLGLTDHLASWQLHDALLSTLGPAEQSHALTDPLFNTLFPFEPHHAQRPLPAVPAALKSHVAADRLPLLTGGGVEAWGDLTLAAFASRLPGLSASSRGYLQRQFLHTAGHITLGEYTLELTLQGPDLAMILTMGGFSGVQCRLPHLGNRLLLITLASLAT